jgi:P-type conjugative transfer protein TrbG
MRKLVFALLCSTTLAACASSDVASGPTVLQGPSEPPPPMVVERMVPVSVPTPMKLLEEKKPERVSPTAAVNAANRDAIRVPDPNDFVHGAVMEAPVIPGAVYQIYAAVDRITEIDLLPGEVRDTVVISNSHLWEVKEAFYGDDENKVTAILIEPFKAGLRDQDLIITTNKGRYRFAVNTYSQTHNKVFKFRDTDGLSNRLPPRSLSAAAGEPVGHKPRIPTDLGDYGYAVQGKASWKPSAVFTHGGRTYIEFPTGRGPMVPPSLVATADGERVVNYHVEGRYMVVPDEVLMHAELRRDGDTVTIIRERE